MYRRRARNGVTHFITVDHHLELEWRTVTRIVLFLFAAGCVSAQQLPSGLYAIFNTLMGNITARLYEKETPITVEIFVALAQGAKATRNPKTGTMVKAPLYNNITFRATPPVPARTAVGAPDSGGCQFFITTGPMQSSAWWLRVRM
jgi:hypothetical protein